MKTADELFDGSNAHLLDNSAVDPSGYADFESEWAKGKTASSFYAIAKFWHEKGFTAGKNAAAKTCASIMEAEGWTDSEYMIRTHFGLSA